MFWCCCSTAPSWRDVHKYTLAGVRQLSIDHLGQPTVALEDIDWLDTVEDPTYELIGPNDGYPLDVVALDDGSFIVSGWFDRKRIQKFDSGGTLVWEIEEAEFVAMNAVYSNEFIESHKLLLGASAIVYDSERTEFRMAGIDSTGAEVWSGWDPQLSGYKTTDQDYERGPKTMHGHCIQGSESSNFGAFLVSDSAGAITGGTFTITADGDTTSALTWPPTTSQIETALAGIGLTVSVFGQWPRMHIRGSVPNDISVDSSDLSDGEVIVHLQDGATGPYFFAWPGVWAQYRVLDPVSIWGRSLCDCVDNYQNIGLGIDASWLAVAINRNLEVLLGGSGIGVESGAVGFAKHTVFNGDHIAYESDVGEFPTAADPGGGVVDYGQCATQGYGVGFQPSGSELPFVCTANGLSPLDLVWTVADRKSYGPIAFLSGGDIIIEVDDPLDYQIARIDYTDGSEVWAFSSNGRAPYAVDENDIIYCADGRTNDADGNTLDASAWTPISTRNIDEVLCVERDGSVVYTGTSNRDFASDDHLQAVDPSDGSVIWSAADYFRVFCAAIDPTDSTRLWVGGLAYISGSWVQGQVRCYDRADGSVMNTFPQNNSGVPVGSIAVDGAGRVHLTQAITDQADSPRARYVVPARHRMYDGVRVFSPDCSGGAYYGATTDADDVVWGYATTISEDADHFWYQWDESTQLLWGIGSLADYGATYTGSEWKGDVVVWLNPYTGERGHYTPVDWPHASSGTHFHLCVDAANEAFFWLDDDGVLERVLFDGTLDTSDGVPSGGGETNYLYRHIVLSGDHLYFVRFRNNATGTVDAVGRLNSSDLSVDWSDGPGDGLRDSEVGEQYSRGFARVFGDYVWFGTGRVNV